MKNKMIDHKMNYLLDFFFNVQLLVGDFFPCIKENNKFWRYAGKTKISSTRNVCFVGRRGSQAEGSMYSRT